jgi:hypothetical protein
MIAEGYGCSVCKRRPAILRLVDDISAAQEPIFKEENEKKSTLYRDREIESKLEQLLIGLTLSLSSPSVDELKHEGFMTQRKMY